MLEGLNKLGSKISTGIGKEDDEFKDLRSVRDDVEVKSLGYVVQCDPCGHLIGDGEGGLDDAGGWSYGGYNREPETYEFPNGDEVLFLDGWPVDMLIFVTREDAEKAIEIVIAHSEEEGDTYIRDDFTIKEVFSVSKVVSTIGIR